MLNKDTMSRIYSMLLDHEGFRGYVYDDATAKEIVPGSQVQGHPTVGIGRALDVNEMTEEEAVYLLNNDVARTVLGLERDYIWFPNLAPARQAVCVDMAFNLGLGGFAKFVRMIAALENSDWYGAAAEMEDSAWAKQVGRRATKLARMMRSGAFDEPKTVSV